VPTRATIAANGGSLALSGIECQDFHELASPASIVTPATGLGQNGRVPSGLSAQLFPDQTRVAPGERLTYNVLNTGSIPIAFGRPHRLERLEAGEWKRQPAEPSLRTPLYTLHPAHARQFKLKLPRRTRGGRYRLTLEVRDYARRTEPRFLGGIKPDGPLLKLDVRFEFDVASDAAEDRGR
jgi:hypothetical protein